MKKNCYSYPLRSNMVFLSHTRSERQSNMKLKYPNKSIIWMSIVSVPGLSLFGLKHIRILCHTDPSIIIILMRFIGMITQIFFNGQNTIFMENNDVMTDHTYLQKT